MTNQPIQNLTQLDLTKAWVLDVETGTGRGTKAGPSAFNRVPLVAVGVGLFCLPTVGTLQYKKEITPIPEEATNLIFIGHNVKFDILHLLVNDLITIDQVRGATIIDTSLIQFRLEGHRTIYPSLAYCCEQYGIPTKTDKVKEFWNKGVDTGDIPKSIVMNYLRNDVVITRTLAQQQVGILNTKSASFNNMLMLDLAALKSAIILEYNGICIDVHKFNVHKLELGTELSKLGNELRDNLYGVWTTKDDTCRCNDVSDSKGNKICALEKPDLSNEAWQKHMIYGVTDSPNYIHGSVYRELLPDGTPALYKSGKKKGLPRTKISKEIDLNSICVLGTFPSLPDSPLSADSISKFGRTSTYVTNYLKKIKLDKDYNTYFLGLSEFLYIGGDKGYIHGNLNFTAVTTGRLSSSKPNLQNISGKDTE